MVDYSKWDRLDLDDSDSDAGEAEGARKGDALREALFADMISLARKKEAAETKMAEATYGPVPPPNLPRENTNSAEKTDRVCNERRLRGKSKGKACNIASNDEAANSLHGGSQLTATGSSETIRFDNGTYEGELKDGKPHGKGKVEFVNGEVYDGEWRGGQCHGKGKLTGTAGDMYDGEWENGKKNGWGKSRWGNGDVYEGQYKDDLKHGKGTWKYTSDGVSRVYEGEFRDGFQEGWGTQTSFIGVYEGEWARGNQHGKGTLKLLTGDIMKGEFEEGLWRGGGLAKEEASAPSYSYSNAGTPRDIVAPNRGEHRAKENRGFNNERAQRSQRSQQRRLQNGMAERKTCENCGVDDYHYKLRVCSGCNLAFYCSATCQKAASRSHQRICDIISQLPSRHAELLHLRYDRDKMVDLDAGLRYATKHMDNLKHLQINLKKMASGCAIKFSTKKLSSLLRSKKGKLDSVFLLSSDGYDEVHGTIETEVWKELHSLKQLHLCYMRFDDVQPVCDIIDQQRDTLMVLGLPFLGIQWRKAKPRRTVAQAIGACKHLVALDLGGCVLMDSDLKVMLQDLINLRTLNLRRYRDDSHEFTDNTCGLIARKCPGLQELDLDHHNQLSVRGIRKIFEGCSQLLSFYTTSHKLSGKDIHSLLDVAPQLLYFSLDDEIRPSAEELDEMIEATGGRTVLQLSMGCVFEPESVSAKTRERYECQKDVLDEIWSNRLDPVVANEWVGCLK